MRTTPHATRRGPHPEEIKAAIRKRDRTLAALSRDHGYGEDAVRKALQRPWPAVERIIADFLGLEPWALWPERYDADHKPLRGRAPSDTRPVTRRRRKGVA